jgi:glycosyltransferase involved in cell wall biosynthesis
MLDSGRASAGLVSVVVPTYRRPTLLREALESAVNQEYTNLEILVCDDDNSDEVADLIAQLGDERIVHRRNERRLGMGQNKSAGYRAASGDYFFNLDDDDVLLPGFVGALVEQLERDDDLVLAFCDHWFMSEDGDVDAEFTDRITEEWRAVALGKHMPFIELGLVSRAIPAAQTAIFRRSDMDLSYFPDLADVTSDIWLIYLACRTGKGAYFLSERLTKYRRHAGSSTTEAGLRWHASFVACYEQFILDQRLGQFREHFERELGLASTRAAAAALEVGEKTQARRYAARGLRHHPSVQGGLVAALAYAPFGQRLVSPLRAGKRSMTRHDEVGAQGEASPPAAGPSTL